MPIFALPGQATRASCSAFFDSIPQDRLMTAVATPIADGPLLELVHRFLKQGMMESRKGLAAFCVGFCVA